MRCSVLRPLRFLLTRPGDDAGGVLNFSVAWICSTRRHIAVVRCINLLIPPAREWLECRHHRRQLLTEFSVLAFTILKPRHIADTMPRPIRCAYRCSRIPAVRLIAVIRWLSYTI